MTVEELLRRGLSQEESNRLKEAWLAETARRSGSRSFAAFVKQAWPYTPQVDPLVWSWHMDAVCAHLEEVAKGGIPRLLVNIPPGHAKSVVVSVLWPAWIWTWWPRCQFLFASHAADLAIRDSMRCRAVVESEWYREMHSGPGGWVMRADQNAKGYFINTAGGERFATGVGGTGRRAHVIGIDDPLNVDELHSKAARDAANSWLSQTISQRFIDPKRPKIATIMQRLHEEDPSGFLLAGGGWEHLMLPSEFDPERQCVTHRSIEKANGRVEVVREEFWRDPRRKKGELLFPERFPREVIERYKLANELGAQGYASQHDQLPSPASGNLFDRSWWRFWKPDGLAPNHSGSRPRGTRDDPARALPATFENVFISVDANFRDSKTADPVAIHVFARKAADFFLLHRVSGPLGFAKTTQAIREVRALYPNVRKVLIEARANGDAIIETLRSEIPGVVGIEPKGGKEARAWAIQPVVQAGNIYLPDGAPWLDYFVDQFASFPKGKHDDDVDALSQAITDCLHGPETTAQKWVRALS